MMNYEMKMYRYKEFKKVLGKNLHAQSWICSKNVIQDVKLKRNGQQVLIKNVLSRAGLKNTDKPKRLSHGDLDIVKNRERCSIC